MLLLENYFNDLKLRIWHKTEKKLVYFNNPTLIDGETLKGGLIFRNYDHKIQDIHECNPEDIIIMFYTGRNDIKNKPIYAGDILKETFVCDGETVEDYTIVEYDKMAASFKMCRPNYVKDSTYFDELDDEDQIEVVGNIYENQNIIEGAKC